MIILKLNQFYVKIKDEKFVCGQFNVVNSESDPVDLITAIRDVHSRMTIAYFDTSKMDNLKAAIEKSDENIKIAADKLFRTIK